MEGKNPIVTGVTEGFLKCYFKKQFLLFKTIMYFEEAETEKWSVTHTHTHTHTHTQGLGHGLFAFPKSCQIAG